MSDREAGVATLETRMDDIRAVMDAADFPYATLIGVSDGSALAALFAATYPERTSALVLINATPRFVRSPELPWLPTRAERAVTDEELVRDWGDRDRFVERWLKPILPSATPEELLVWARYIRVSISPGSFAAYWRMNMDLDVCDVLPSIRVPTLVMNRTGDSPRSVRTGHYVADHIPGARFVQLPGADIAPALGDSDTVLAELDAFLGEVAEGKQWEVEPDRVLATVLFTDLVASTAKALELGPRWRELLREHNAVIRHMLTQYRGREIDTAGDGFFASGFDGPARAIRCACAIRDAVNSLGLQVRVGVHTGECDIVDGKLSGLAVAIGSRIAAQADDCEVLVSGTVRDLVVGSGITFEPRGTRDLKGLGEWTLFAITGSGKALP
jgi:class 3 adenylate cyclase